MPTTTPPPGPPNEPEGTRVDVAYAQPAPWYAQRRAFRVIVLLLILNIVATTSITWGPPLMQMTRDALAARRAAAQQAQALAADMQAAAAARARQKAEQDAWLAAYRKAAAVIVPADQLVYTEDPAEADRLVREGGAYAAVPQGGQEDDPSAPRLPAPPARWKGSAAFAEAAAALNLGAQGIPVFVGERKTRAGQTYLLWVTLEAERTFTHHTDAGRPYALGQTSRSLKARVIQPHAGEDVGQLFGASPSNEGATTVFEHVLEFPQPPDRLLRAEPGAPADGGGKTDVIRVFAGKADLNHPGHFVVYLELNGRRTAVDYWLETEQHLRVVPRAGAINRGEHGERTVEGWDPFADTAPQEPAEPVVPQDP
ncbi:MAG TPA: hypothetical protein VFB66_03005 [Tepidisphaeraceae bacterium]|nr:hypothetical protein [Tepidisphaeraceae bacterium]